MKRVLATLLTLALFLSLVPATMAEETNKIVFQMGEEPRRMDPTMNDYSSGSYALQNLFRGLYKFDADGLIVPAMAESYEVSEDGTVYTFKLKEGLMWSDGSPLTAHDFEYSWKRVLDPELASETAYSLYGAIKNGRECFVDGTVAVEDLPITALDDLTLQVELYAPTPYFISMLASSVFFPVKQEVVEADKNWEWNDKIYVSNGPYRIKEMKRDEKFILEKNPYYYNADNVQIDEIELVFLDAMETVLVAFENGELDIAVSVNADAIEKYQGTDTLMLTPRIGYRWYEFRTDHEPFDDARVRLALAMAIDREVITNIILKTYEAPLLGFIPNGYPDLVDGTKSWREAHGNAFEEDVEKAQALLAEAGYPNGEGFPTFRLVQETSSNLSRVAEALQQMWKQNLGIEAEIVIVEGGVYWATDTGTRHSGDFDVCYMGYTGDYLDPYSMLSNFYSRDVNSNFKTTQWSNDEYDDLMELVSSGVTGAEREALFEHAEEILAEEMPIIPIYNYTAMALVSDRVGGFTRNYIGHPNMEYCYIK